MSWFSQVSDSPGYEPSKLVRFIVFSPPLSKSERDLENKIIYHHPPDAPLGEKVQSVGLIEGLCSFTKVFAGDQAITQNLFLRKNKLWFKEVEEDYYFVVMVEHPKIHNKDKVSWKERLLEPLLLQRMIEFTYDAWYLLYGKMSDMMKERGVEYVIEIVEDFFKAYMPALDVSKLNVFDTFDGIRFQSLDRNLWLSVQSFMDETEDVFPEIEHSAIFFQEKLVCSSLRKEDMKSVYRYIFSFPTNIMQVSARAKSDSAYSLPLFHRSDKVYFKSGKAFFLVALKLHEITYVFFVDEFSSHESLQKIQDFVTENAKPFLEFLRHVTLKNLKVDPGLDHRYIYFNHANWAIKTSLALSNKPLQRETFHVIGAIHADFMSTDESRPNEVAVKTHNGSWVVGRYVDQREIFVVFENSDESLLDVEEKVTKLLKSRKFGNIFLW